MLYGVGGEEYVRRNETLIGADGGELDVEREWMWGKRGNGRSAGDVSGRGGGDAGGK